MASVVALQEHAIDEPFDAWDADVKQRTTPRAEWCYVVDCTARSFVPCPTGHPGNLNSPCYHPANTHEHAASTFDRSAR